MWWKCKEGHPSYRAKLVSRSNRTGCPYLPGIPCHGSSLYETYRVRDKLRLTSIRFFETLLVCQQP
ncbi:hypothetical protein CN689_23710 [Peribacillus butanolivorans]|uniref:Treble clef zinc finger domain-containing protein n=1 Tax=Peribacillus butanolivorans TaxID=421767 RepID=A0AAX0RZ06_9BACI|nr:hypothetical protein DTO10_25985 [Peribacillus butanolivorans]PEJ27382.1 hypothetical protein CN689_23710 [Peribacillus butanolivorans]